MKKFWLVVWHEYSRHVLRRRFIFALLSVPALIGVMVLVGFLVVRMETSTGPIGYVDSSGFLADPIWPQGLEDERENLRAFTTEEEARAALEGEEISAYYLLPSGYPQDREVQLVYFKPPREGAVEAFEELLQANLLADQPAEVFERVDSGAELVVRTPDGRREISDRNWFNILLPFAAGLVFMLAIFTSSGYLMQAVVEEKENRTMEIVVTSVSPGALMSGKVVGIIGVGMTQLLVWVAAAVLAVVIGGRYVDFLGSISVDPGYVGLLFLIMIPSFVLVSALMAMVGATVTEEREGQQITGIFTLPVVAPYWFTYQLMSNPNGPLAVALSYFPLTSPVALTMRAGFTTLSTTQIALNLAVLTLFALAALWLAGRAFRLGMLRYGQRVSWGELFGRAPRQKEAQHG